jgi:glutamyl-tRNA synthetase
MSKQVECGFAPSPTGPLHIGTALFNYLFAKKMVVIFYELKILIKIVLFQVLKRIYEAIRMVREYHQMKPGKNEKVWSLPSKERKPLYKEYAEQLINYWLAIMPLIRLKHLDTARKEQEEQGKTFIYNHTNRELLDTSLVISTEETAKRIQTGCLCDPFCSW